ncbi:non-ribosomal peptide synthetase [Motilibacter aurantiacus]|uniref:non-ribosomal peptide synthetase n=1 Tax=Motilibacter aurantiacus TaxID=2714955 RepID=UPI0014078F0F|nr:non-ribosomal peptide synthetase [Motilibacter aurantiacus]NHC44333.1 amino acid adenylation domain-containing protein [Motilibacter aurantiacus]
MSTDTFLTRLRALDPAKRTAVLDALYGTRLQALRSAPRPDAVPLSPAQQRLWYLARTGEQDASYNIPGYFRLSRAVDVEELRAALGTIARRHEILRTRVVGDPPRLEVEPAYAPELEVVDGPADEAGVTALAAGFVRRPFDISRLPLWRALLVRQAAGRSYLVLSFHHIVFDGWSLKVFLGELLRLLDGQQLEPLEWQYPDYAQWERARHELRRQIDSLRGEEPGPSADERFWVDYLRDPGGPLRLSVEGPAAPVGPEGGLLVAELRGPEWQPLVAAARAEGATPFAAALAVFDVLLQQRSGQDDIVVGTPVSGRSDSTTHQLIGTFVNTIPLRIRLDGAMTVRELLRAVAASSLDAFAHEDVAFDRIVELTNPVRSAGVHPVFQTLFTFQPAVDLAPVGGLRADYLDLDFGTSKFDLSLDVVEENDGVRLLLEYDTRRYSRATVQSLADSYRGLVAAMAADPASRLRDLPLLGPAQREEVIARSRGPVLEPVHASVVDAFEAAARRAPQAPAVTDADRTVGYAELAALSDRVRDQVLDSLRDAPVVAVMLPRSAALFAALLGVWKAGKACLVLDPALPVGRLRAMADDADAPVLTERTHVLERFELAEGGRRVLILSELPAAPVARSRAGADAYLVYTSGSTGRPKGVRVPHASYAAMLRSWSSAFELDAPECLQLAGSSFDVFYGDVARALGTGGHLRVVEAEAAADPSRFADLVHGRSFDFAEFVPSVFRRLVAELARRGRRLDIRNLVVASEAWAPAEAAEWRRDVLAPGTALFNTYGVAEATVDSTIFRVPEEGVAGARMPIGRPLPNCEVYVVDAAGRLVPPGVAGQLVVGGRGLGAGYVSADESRFSTAAPAGVEQRVYQTGDLGFRNEDGDLVLLGRNDDQVKLRGVRIELGEVEQAVRALPGVREAAALVSGTAEDARLVAWVVPDVRAADAASWRQRLVQRLPGALVPELLLTDELPYLPSGKVDRARLSQLEVPRSRRERVLPRTAEEEAMAALFGAVLGLDDVGVDESFFALGGHSLTALDLLSRVHREIGVRLRVGELFDSPTVEGLVQRVAALHTPADDRPVPLVEPDPEHRHDPFPLTDVQQAYWLGRDGAFEFSGVSTHSYDELQSEGLQVDRLTRALNQVIERHEMMRAVVLDHGGQQILREVPDYVPRVHDLREAAQEEIDAGLQHVRDELSHQKLDMTRWPNFDIRISLLPGDVQVLHFSTDALLLDAASFTLVLRELAMIYDGLPLPELEFSFRDYVLADRQFEQSERFARTKAYWDRRIPTLPGAPGLPMARRPDELQEPRFTRLHARVPKEVWESLKRAAGKHGLTPSGVCLTAYAQVLAGRVQDPRFSLNLTFLNRKPFHPQVDQVAGEFTSLTLLPVDLADRPAFVEAARRIQRDLWEVLEENDMSGVRVLREYARHHNSPGAAHFPVVFTSALGIPMPDSSFPVRHQPELGVTQTSQVWLDAGIWEAQGEDLRCNWDVVLDVYPEGFVEAMFAEWVALLHRLAGDPAAWDGPAALEAPAPLEIADVPAGTLLDPFLASLEATPHADAVISPTRTLTYAELASRAGGVAAALRAHGVRAGEPVAVMMEPGWEQTAAVLGTVAVGAYLPLNADTPAERLLTITELAGVRCLLTQPWMRDRLAEVFPGTVLTVDDVDTGSADALRSHTVRAEDLAYVIFTSGSTGVPKGVMIDHRGALNTIVDVNERYGVGPADRVLALSSLSFDLSVYDVFGLLAAGGALVVPDPARRLDPLHQIDLVTRHGVTVWNTVPALFNLFVGALDAPCPELRVVLLSGDWIPLGLPAAAWERCPKAELHSLGGATEASIWSITYPVTVVDPAWNSVPYGKGMKNQDVVVLDADLRPAPPWVTGDLYIRGVGLALGYWGSAELTDAAFVRHPVSGERLYRTGDLGRLMSDGNIEFLGRSDFQLKIGGYRVEAGEVERAILRHPAVAETTVLALGDKLADKRLACAWVRAEGTDGEVDLPEFLAPILPAYMVPLVVAELPALPLSGNGKVDRKTLERQLGALATTATAPYVPPTRPEERRMVELWESTLGRQAIGLHDDFFQLGGDSIDAIELVTRLRRLDDAQIGLRDLYAARTPAGLVLRLAAGADAPGTGQVRA